MPRLGNLALEPPSGAREFPGVSEAKPLTTISKDVRNGINDLGYPGGGLPRIRFGFEVKV